MPSGIEVASGARLRYRSLYVKQPLWVGEIKGDPFQGRPEIVDGGRAVKALSFPKKVVMMGNGGDFGFDDKFRDSESEGDIHRNRQCILNHKNIKAEF
jgi:hypothetical protein